MMARRRETWHSEVYGNIDGEQVKIMDIEMIVERQPDGAYVVVDRRQTMYVSEEERLGYSQRLVDAAAERMQYSDL